jgi:hypothetical protein
MARYDTERGGRSRSIVRIGAIAAILALAAAACGDDESSTDDAPDEPTTSEPGELVNACPEDGCTITITDAVAEGDELQVTWETNFAPDVARNHTHVYWDTFSADQVSGDAAARGVAQGDWVPTGDDPVFETEGAVSVAVRGDSTTICVTAADRDHTVLDATLVDCRDVGDLLSP